MVRSEGPGLPSAQPQLCSFCGPVAPAAPSLVEPLPWPLASLWTAATLWLTLGALGETSH